MKYVDLNAGWSFWGGDIPWYEKRIERKVDLPHDWQIELARREDAVGGSGAGYYPGGRGAYDISFDAGVYRGKRVLLYLDGAYMLAEVTLNGARLALHPYGYTAFTVELTDHLFYDKENKLTVVTQCRQPNSRWYSGAGLYRGAYLWVGEPDFVSPWDVRIATRGNAVSVSVDGRSDCCVTIWDGDVNVGAGLQCEIANARFWSLDDPHLYTARVTPPSGDATDVRFGLRDIAISPEKGMTLNGAPIKLKGGCMHHDNGPLGACSYPAAERRRVMLLKRLGYNAIRCAHNPPSESFLNACDELGMLVMDEAFDCWIDGKNGADYHLFFEHYWASDVDSMVRRDRNHPSVFAWSTGNEIPERDGHNDGALWAQKLADRIRALDDTRPVINAMNDVRDARGFRAGTEPFRAPLDISGMNYLHTVYDTMDGLCVIGTETFVATAWESWQATLARPNVLGDFIWAAIDYLGEAGIGRVLWDDAEDQGFCAKYPWRLSYCSDLDICGFRRPQSYYHALMWGADTKASLFTQSPERYAHAYKGNGWEWNEVRPIWNYDAAWIGKPLRVEAYADAEEAEFYVNGALAARSRVENLRAKAVVPYEPGELTCVLRASGREDTVCALRTLNAPARVALSADCEIIRADGMDLCYITVTLADAAGKPAFGEARLTAEVCGAGRVAAFDSANPTSEERFGTGTCSTYEGKALLVLRASNMPGEIKVRVHGESLSDALLTIKTE